MLRKFLRNPFPFLNPCPAWEYGQVPRASELPRRINSELLAIRDRPRQISLEYARDPRTLHERLFRGLTIPGQPYLAGTYRGHPKYDCLRNREVKVHTPSGPDDTFPPVLVHAMMRRCCKEILEEMATLDLLHTNQQIPPQARSAQVVESAAYILGGFNVVHPFANGNGHVSRLLTFAFLARYDLEPRSWSVLSIRDEAARDAYGALFRAFRAGDSVPLQRFLHDKIAGR